MQKWKGAEVTCLRSQSGRPRMRPWVSNPPPCGQDHGQEKENKDVGSLSGCAGGGMGSRMPYRNAQFMCSLWRSWREARFYHGWIV